MTMPTNEGLVKGEKEKTPEFEKEQIKLRATYLNQIAGNLIIIGVFTPLAAVFYADRVLTWKTWAGFATFFVTSSILHIVAQLILRRIR